MYTFHKPIHLQEFGLSPRNLEAPHGHPLAPLRIVNGRPKSLAGRPTIRKVDTAIRRIYETPQSRTKHSCNRSAKRRVSARRTYLSACSSP